MTPTEPVDPGPMTVDMSMVTTDGVGYNAPAAGRLVIVAGRSETEGSVTFSCAAGGDDCTVTVAADGSVTATGGDVTAMNSAAYSTELANAADQQRMSDVAAARSEAEGFYMAADGDATDADTAARAAAATAPNSPGAMAARTAADAARAAATAARTAHDSITDDMDKTAADALADEAEKQAGIANSSYMTAMRENNAIQTAAIVEEEKQKERDISAAQTAAKEYADEALEHYNAAMMKAGDARAQATAARAAANKAKAARMDYANANKYAVMAETAATAAEAAEALALAAKDAAQAAYADAMAAETVMAAQAARDTAKAQNEIATAQHTGENGAGMQYMAAKDAAGKAEMAADVQVLSLFLAANGAHVADLETTMDLDEKAVHVTSVGTAMATIAAATSGAQAAGTTVTTTWPGDTVENPTTDAEEFSEGTLSITVTVAGATAIAAELRADRAATDLNNDGDTADEGEARIIQTAMEIDDLGVFRGYDLWEDDGDPATSTDRARAILFTNKQKGKDSILAMDGGAARSVSSQAVTAGELSNVTSTGLTITGVTWKPSGEAPLTGTLTCPDATACNIVLGEDGAVAAITGYTFAGSRATVEAATAADATDDTDYLAFGLWLVESDDGATDTFGSFAVGGNTYGPAVAVTGTAMYSGKAAGAHHMTGMGVNWFDGNASLTADFGDATAAGTISGMVSNIRVAGGDPMSAPIYLGQAALAGGTATFNGAAFMGAATAPGASTHEFDGTWSGEFFGPTVNDPETTDVDESVAAPLAAAGTFGVTKSTGTGDDMVVESFVGSFGAHKQ